MVRHPRSHGRNAAGVASSGNVCRRDCRDYRQGDAHRRVVDGGGDAGGVNRRNQRQARRRDQRRAVELRQPADLADRRVHHDFARHSENRPGRAHRLLLHFPVRQKNAGHRLQPRHLRADPRAGNAEQHRARRRHHPSGDEGHRVELRLRPRKRHAGAHRPLSRAGELPQQPDHIGDVHHRHRAQPAGGGHHRQSHRQRHPSELGHLGGGHAAARPCGHAADAAGTVFRQPARNQSHAQRGAVCQRASGRAGQNERRRENHAGDFRPAAHPVGGHPRAGFRRRVCRRCHHHRLYRPLAAAALRRAFVGRRAERKKRVGHDHLVCRPRDDGHLPQQTRPDFMVFRRAQNRHRTHRHGLDGCLHAAASGVHVRPLYVRQHHRPHHRHAGRLLRGGACARRAADGLRPDYGRRVQPDDDPHPLRHRHRPRNFRLGLRHTGRMVEGRLRDERGQPAGIPHRRRHLVEGLGLLVNRSA